ncbi:Atg19 [Kluyveromyces lactis]|nr:Atg19 [Kluyveromyces lactis]
MSYDSYYGHQVDIHFTGPKGISSRQVIQARSSPDMVALRKMGLSLFQSTNIFDSYAVTAKVNEMASERTPIRNYKDLESIWDDVLTVGTLYIDLAEKNHYESHDAGSITDAITDGNDTKMSIPSSQWDKLIRSLEKLELSIRGNNVNSSSSEDTVHEGIVCDGCQGPADGIRVVNTKTADQNGFIKGPRFCCLYCHDYDLCSECEKKGFTSGTHKSYHNFVKVVTPDAKLKSFTSDYLKSTHQQVTRPSRYNQVPAPSRYNQVPAPSRYNQAPAPSRYYQVPAPSRYNQFPAPPRYNAEPLPSEIKVEGFYGKDKTSPRNSSPRVPAANVQHDFNDVIIEVGQQNKAMFDFFAEIKTESELEKLMQDAISWRIAKQWYGEDIYEKLERYQNMMQENAQKERETESADEAIMKTQESSNPSLRVEMFQKGHLLTFKLFNDGDETIPNGLKLVFQCEQKGRVATPIKCNLQVGPDELQPGNYKILNFNYRGTLEEFSFEQPCKIDLIDVREQVIFTTEQSTVPGSSVFHLKPPVCKTLSMGDRRNIPCNEDEDPDVQYTLASPSHSDTDVISSSVTDQEEEEEEEEEENTAQADNENNDLVYVESLSEEYDLLSDSDFDHN